MMKIVNMLPTSMICKRYAKIGSKFLKSYNPNKSTTVAFIQMPTIYMDTL